jgi:hypothetical protein
MSANGSTRFPSTQRLEKERSGSFILLAVALFSQWQAIADPLPSGWKAEHVKPLGYVRTLGPNTFKLAMQRVGKRWYLVAATRPARGAAKGSPGFEVIDVTDPTKMFSVAHVAVADADEAPPRLSPFPLGARPLKRTHLLCSLT